MPALPNLKHERFCRAWIKTGVAAQAYLRAGYTASTRSSLDTCASRLLRHAQVKARVNELRRQMAARNRVTVDSLVEELDEAKALALRIEQPASAISAIAAKAKLVGLMVERKETGAPGDFGQATEAQTLELVRRELGDDVAAQLAKALGEAATAPETPSCEEAMPPPIEPTNEGSDTVQ